VRIQLLGLLADLEAAATATTPGKGRTWFVPYLAAALRVYRKLTTQTVNGRALSRALGKNPRDAFFKLLKTSKRDSKTRSRWAAVLANAYKSDIPPNQFSNWLRKGGGAAGRAAELSKASCGPKQTTNQTTAGIPTGSPQPKGSPQASDVVAEATKGDEQLK
jgi:hypothetical protein